MASVFVAADDRLLRRPCEGGQSRASSVGCGAERGKRRPTAAFSDGCTCKRYNQRMVAHRGQAIRKLQDIKHNLEILSQASRRDGMSTVDELDGLPLALVTVGVYLDQASTSFTDYLQLCKALWLRLQLSYEDRALYSTWNISLEHAK
ncbi:hypothetical protein PSV08DRAFT_404518 [Bipolaris maydis]|uniref:uncharacterized protein n=1 Tax=Cochliobolus heterostrophus TaxID=5016 RepID=UPI0024D83003|nr:hypothetical protein PSV08DRAFT_404518 [Bipolaris maydis]